MEHIRVSRYRRPESVGYQGWIETGDWIIWVHNNGNLFVGTGRASNGAVSDITEIEV